MTDSFRHDELTIFLRKIIGTEQDVPEDEFYSIVARVAVALRNVRSVMPAVHLWCNEQVIQDSALYIGGAMGEEPAYVCGGNGQQDRIGIEADNAEDEEYDDVSQSEIDWIGNSGVQDVQISCPMMIRVKLPQERIGMLEAMHPVAEEAH